MQMGSKITVTKSDLNILDRSAIEKEFRDSIGVSGTSSFVQGSNLGGSPGNSSGSNSSSGISGNNSNGSNNSGTSSSNTSSTIGKYTFPTNKGLNNQPCGHHTFAPAVEKCTSCKNYICDDCLSEYSTLAIPNYESEPLCYDCVHSFFKNGADHATSTLIRVSVLFVIGAIIGIAIGASGSGYGWLWALILGCIFSTCVEWIKNGINTNKRMSSSRLASNAGTAGRVGAFIGSILASPIMLIRILSGNIKDLKAANEYLKIMEEHDNEYISLYI